MKLDGKKLKKESLERLKELYEKATEKEDSLFTESLRLRSLAEEVSRFRWRIAYWLGKKKAKNCIAFRKIGVMYGRCLANNLDATFQELFRYWCAKCQLTKEDKTYLILDNKLRERR